MKNSTYFITGTSTDVGKTVVSAAIVEALHADYWKPIQAGELDYCDTKKVKNLISNKKSEFYDNAFSLKIPMSPHAAAEIDNVSIDMKKIKRPKTKNNIVIEGAGGLLVPLNDKKTILDLIQPNDKVIVVSRHYLGSINHTLLTLSLLKEKGLETALVFSGNEHKTTEDIIKKMTGVTILGRIEEEPYFDKNVVKEYANKLKPELLKL